ncbi:hypothetical protein [Methylobacterium brachiatum]|jgi:hypothetical protein|uniref:hypothetical protein n=1 Tax=Methylobacterium brachiatum TaxID=269660 RepID=UPI0024488301|nr:hypothetical protein [Methylobacterium brachiatum]MDH2312370.1 hypothetical protein [Methylobacterium brachiatum]
MEQGDRAAVPLSRTCTLHHRSWIDDEDFRQELTFDDLSDPGARLFCPFVDLNADHIALCHVSHGGNPLGSWRIPLAT